MARPEGHLRVMMSTRVLLNLEEADSIFKKKHAQILKQTGDTETAHSAAVEAYTNYVCPSQRSKYYDPETGGRRFEKGPLFDFAEALVALNKRSNGQLVELIISAKDENQSGDVIFRNIDLMGSDTFKASGAQRVTTAGKDLSQEIHEIYETDLLLTRNDKDAQVATDLGIAASTIYFSPTGFGYSYDHSTESGRQVKLFFDGDAVAFGGSSEARYREIGLEAYTEAEFNDFMKDIEPGPFTEILSKISQLNNRFPRSEQPFELSLVTARGGSSHSRALAILKKFNITINGVTLGRAGADKARVLEKLQPDLYIDDQFTHLKNGAEYCPVGLVHYPTGSSMQRLLHLQKAEGEVSKLREAEKIMTTAAFAGVAAKKEGKKPETPALTPK